MDLHIRFFSSRKWKNTKKSWHKFSQNPLSVLGLVIVLSIVFLALFAPYIAPYPQHAETYIYDPSNANLFPSWDHLFGTDEFGRDILSRVLYGLRYSLMMVAVVLTLITPPGVVLGLYAGYYKGSLVDPLIMRVTDIFICVPPLVLAMAVCTVTTPSVFNAMMAISLMWWPWYCRLTYSMTASLRNEFFVKAAEASGASTFHILFKEVLPNCLAPILTKMTLDGGWIILLGASLSFLGLGAQPPTPDLGTMVSDGAKFLPAQWWISIFPGVTILFIILAFNLLGDGVRDLFATEEL